MDADKIRDAGGPAFPLRGADYGSEGMTLRDYFAAQWLNAGLAPDFLIRCMTEQEVAMAITNASALAYRLADAMLAERNK